MGFSISGYSPDTNIGATQGQAKYTGEVKEINGRKTQLNSLGQRVYTDSGFLAPASADETVEGAAQTAMEETQKRAAEDKEQALAEMRAGKSEALGEDYGAWKESIEGMGSGEYGEDIKEQMLAKSVIPVESQTQQMIKDIQRSYYGGGTPGGMQQMLTQQAKLSGIGQAGGLRRDIEIASEGSRQAGLGKQSSALGQLAQYRGGISTGTSSKLADILGHTITAVPDYSSVPAITSSGGGGTTTTSGGSMRTSTAPRPNNASTRFGNLKWGR